MPLESIVRVIGRGVPLPGEDVDTDRIVPARFLRAVTFDELGCHAFEDARAEAQSQGTLHPFDDPRYAGGAVLVVGRNFGCGSSREHAARAIAKRGIHAIVGESFGDIFAGNAVALGIPCVCVPRTDVQAILRHIEADPATVIEVNVERLRIRVGEAEFAFSIPAAVRRALLDGAWDPIADLLARGDAIDATAARLDYLRWARPAREAS
jgi:3-isopropylmalate/(R)-2-methylmalate dehydratase small subunit